MQKEDEPDNLYILWTASIGGKYYRLYRVFNMVTEELGMKVFLMPADLINKVGKDISQYPQGDFSDLLEYVSKMN